MSERSELNHDGAYFAAKRRSGHWCYLSANTVSSIHDVMVHQ